MDWVQKYYTILLVVFMDTTSVIGISKGAVQCPSPLRVTWVNWIPYVASPLPWDLTKKESDKGGKVIPIGVIASVVKRAASHCCGPHHVLDYSQIDSFEDLGEHYLESEISMPVLTVPGEEILHSLLSNWTFIPVTRSEGCMFVWANSNPSSAMVGSLANSWPLLLLVLCASLIAGILMWMLDHARNEEEFPTSFIKGFWEGIWWAFVTMTTVGYGDKAPRSIAARIFGLVWMFSGIILMAVFTATLTSAFQAVPIFHISDIAGSKVAVVDASYEAQLAFTYGAEVHSYESILDVLSAVKLHDVDYALVDVNLVLQQQAQLITLDLLHSSLVPHASVLGFLLREVPTPFMECMVRYLLMHNGMAADFLTGEIESDNDTKYRKNPYSQAGKVPSEMASELLGPLHLIIYILAAVWVVLMIGCVAWDMLYRRKHTKNKVLTAELTQNKVGSS